MTRRLLIILTLGLLVVPLAAEAQPARKVLRVGVLTVDSSPASPDWKQHSVFLQELRTRGWREGENLSIEYRWAPLDSRGAMIISNPPVDDVADELVRQH